MFSIQVCR